MSKYHGKSGLVYISTSGTGNAVSVGQLTDWSLDMSTERTDSTCFGDTNKTYTQGLPDRRGTLAGFWNDADDTLFQAMESSDGCRMYLYPSSSAISKYFYGPAFLDLSISNSNRDMVKVSGSFAANGAWGRK